MYDLWQKGHLMADVFTLKGDAKVMNQHPTYGTTFWAHAEEADLPLMFNAKHDSVLDGTRVMAEETTTKTSKAGNDYLHLKKVKIEDNPEAKSSEPFNEKQKKEPTFEKGKAEERSRDDQVTKNMVWKNLLTHYDIPSMEPNTPQWERFWANVELHTEMLIKGNYEDLVRPEEKKDKYKFTKATEFSEEDAPDFVGSQQELEDDRP